MQLEEDMAKKSNSHHIVPNVEGGCDFKLDQRVFGKCHQAEVSSFSMRWAVAIWIQASEVSRRPS